jgi:hypothetical protein
MTRVLLSVGLLLLVALPATSSDVESGPEKGAQVPALKVYDATGENKEKSVDYVRLRKDRPTVYLFVAAGKFSRPMNRFMKTLDTKVDGGFKDVYVVAVWLTDDEDRTKEYLPKLQTSVDYQKTALTVFKGKDGRRAGISTVTLT